MTASLRRHGALWGTALVAAILVVACGGKIPERGSAEWRRALDKGEIFITTQTVPNTNLKQASAVGVIDAPIEVAWELFADADKWNQFLMNVKESRELPSDGHERLMEIVIEPPAIAVGFNDIHFKASISETINHRDGIWRGDYQAIEGNIERGYGAWQLEKWSEGRTLITFTVFNDFGYPSTLDPAVNIFTADFLEAWAQNLRDRVSDPAVRFELEQKAKARWDRGGSEAGPKIDDLGDIMR